MLSFECPQFLMLLSFLIVSSIIMFHFSLMSRYKSYAESGNESLKFKTQRLKLTNILHILVLHKLLFDIIQITEYGGVE